MTVESLIKEAYFKDAEPAKVKADDLSKIAGALTKAASVPYNPETYEAACGIMKIASQAFGELLKKANELEKLSEVRVIVDDMLDRGLISRDDVQVKTSALMKKNENELEVVKEAIKLAGSNQIGGGLFDSESAPSTTSTSPRSMFDQVIYKE